MLGQLFTRKPVATVDTKRVYLEFNKAIVDELKTAKSKLQF